MKAKKAFFHDDDCGHILLPDGTCPTCKFAPDMQSLGLMFVCPTHGVELHLPMRCPVCNEIFERP